MADWLEKVRIALDSKQPLDFRAGRIPHCVDWQWLPKEAEPRRGAILGACLSAMALNGNLLVIGDPKNLNGRASIAKSLAKRGFSNIEPIECQTVYTAAAKLGGNDGAKRFEATLDFVDACMSGTGRADFEEAVTARKIGRRLGAAKFGDLVDIGVALYDGAGDEVCLELLEGFNRRPTTYVFRREMFSAMRSALKMKVTGEVPDLSAAIWQVQNKIRHAGRIIAQRSVGSTLLVKGLEYSHVIVVHSLNMSRKDWYVALTRATHSLKILSPESRFTPPD